MKTWRKAIAAAVMGACVLGAGRLAWAEDEAALIGMLAADKSPDQKDAACQKLRGVATAKSVPALATMLGDDALSQSARMVLQEMKEKEAGDALRDALGKTSGQTLAGIALSVGERRDREAVAALAKLAQSGDPIVASAAAAALGKIGAKEAAGALIAARPKFPAKELGVWADALLECADAALAEGRAQDAFTLYSILDEPQLDAAVTAQYRGILRASGDKAMVLAEKGLTGEARVIILASLKELVALKGDRAALITKVGVELRPALIEVLGQTADPSLVPAILAQVSSDAAPVRLAALKALAGLGDGSCIPALAKVAASGGGAEQEAARFALSRASGTGVREAIAQEIAKAQGPARVELVRALGARNDAKSVPLLLKLIQDVDAAVRVAAVQSLAQAADESTVGDLAKALGKSKSDEERGELEKAINTVCGRVSDKQQLAPPVLAALSGADVAGRCALLRVCGGLTGPAVLSALRDGIKSSDPAIHDAAIRGLSASRDVNAEPDLQALAKNADNLTHRVLALRGCVRLVDALPAEQRLGACRSLMAAASRPDERKLVLGCLGRIPSTESLKLIDPCLSDNDVKAEATAAYAQVAAAIEGSNRAEALAAYRRIVELGGDPKLVNDAKTRIAKLEAGQK